MSATAQKATGLVLSVFPGIDLLGRAFEEEGYCVVRGPDLLWGGDVREFHPPAGVFEGVIGGPPCQVFSRMRYFNPLAGKKHGNLIPEFERVVAEAAPTWFLMENVPEAPEAAVSGFQVHRIVYDNLWAGGVSRRRRAFCFGSHNGDLLVPAETLRQCAEPLPAATAGHSPPMRTPKDRRYRNDTVSDRCVAQGLPATFADDWPFTTHHKKALIGNAVPVHMGRAIAQAVRRATA